MDDELASEVDEDVADDMTIDGVTVDDVTATWQMT
jgi:hypothetical protein